MTTHAHPEPIRLPVIREFDTGSGAFQQIDGYLFVTPDIARQIVAMVLPEDMRRMCADLDVGKLGARIAALEAEGTEWAAAQVKILQIGKDLALTAHDFALFDTFVK